MNESYVLQKTLLMNIHSVNTYLHTHYPSGTMLVIGVQIVYGIHSQSLPFAVTLDQQEQTQICNYGREQKELYTSPGSSLQTA